MSEQLEEKLEREAYIQQRIDKTLHQRLLNEIRKFLNDVEAEDKKHKKAFKYILLGLILSSGIITLFLYFMIG